uniref:TSA: Wollemia nobilis Ref_Wollemi_Transcript_15155_953 transcribed RNA sequence n=1 Tax=Wollemia nobilis TaxID=56998 RepID=A0A0C9S6C4_9CONI
MALALSNAVNSAVCSRNPFHSAVNSSTQASCSPVLSSPWHGGRRQSSVTLRYAVKSCRPKISRRYFHPVQAGNQTFSSFDDMLQKSEQPVLVDFYATWCGPCQYMVPILEDVGRRLKDKIRVVKINTENYPSIASRYGVQALPTFILFRNGQPFDRLEGALPADQLVSWIEKILEVAK